MSNVYLLGNSYELSNPYDGVEYASWNWESVKSIPFRGDDSWFIISINELYNQSPQGEVINVRLVVDGVSYYNYTPHNVNVPTPLGTVILSPYDKNLVPRVGESNYTDNNIDNMIDTVEFSDFINLPEVIKPNEIYIVSLFTLVQMKSCNMDISQFVTTGQIIKRDEQGKPIEWGKLRKLV